MLFDELWKDPVGPSLQLASYRRSQPVLELLSSHTRIAFRAQSFQDG